MGGTTVKSAGANSVIGLVIGPAMSLLFAAHAQAATTQPPQAQASTVTKVAALDVPAYRGTHAGVAVAGPGAADRRNGAMMSARMSAPIAYPLAEAAGPGGSARTEIKGWVLLLMGAFLIFSISQRRYQALSEQ